MDWPKTLPIPMANGYGFTDLFEVIRPTDSLGFSPEIRQGQKNGSKTVSATLLLTFYEFAVFDWFVKRRLKDSAIWLSMPLRFDDGVMYSMARMYRINPVTDGNHWKVSITLEVMTEPKNGSLA